MTYDDLERLENDVNFARMQYLTERGWKHTGCTDTWQAPSGLHFNVSDAVDHQLREECTA